MEAWPHGVLVTAANGTRSADGKIVFVNRAFERMSGYDRDELIDRRRRMLDGLGTDRGELKRLAYQDPGGRPASVLVTQYRKGGAPLRVEVTAFPLPSSHWVYVYREASEDEFIEQQVHRLRDALATETRKAGGEEATLAAMLRAICRMGGWPYGEAWIPRRDGQVLRIGATWRASDDLPEPVLAARKKAASARGGVGGWSAGSGRPRGRSASTTARMCIHSRPRWPSP